MNILNVHCSPVQCFIFFLKRASGGSFLIISSKVYKRKLPLKDKDCIPYDIASGSLQNSVFLNHMLHTFFHKTPIQLMDSCYLMSCMFQPATFYWKKHWSFRYLFGTVKNSNYVREECIEKQRHINHKLPLDLILAIKFFALVHIRNRYLLAFKEFNVSLVHNSMQIEKNDKNIVKS